MYRFFRPLLFRLAPETAHTLTLHLLGLAGRLPPIRWMLESMYAAPDKPVEVFGLKFCNPVGLAAGYDKDGYAVRGLAALGFGHIEIGTVTPRHQAGNDKPRIFRLVDDEAVINRMGFPSAGMQALARRLTPLTRSPIPARIGINLGKNKDTPIEHAAGDYLALMQQFMGIADYLAINISSPNTAGLRRLQGRAMLEALLGAIASEREKIALGRGGHKPILVKLAPDLTDEELDDALAVILSTGMDGVIVTNTTLKRDGLHSPMMVETGGLSGRPLANLSETTLAKTVRRLDGRLPVISVGGIMSAEQAKRRLDAGAALVQIYTGLVYRGPGLIQQIIKST